MNVEQNFRDTGNDWAVRALSYARYITTAFPGRGSTTEGETLAANHVREHLSNVGIDDLRIQDFNGLRSLWLFLAFIFGLALLGHAAFWLLRFPLGILPALIISLVGFALSIYMLWRKFSFQGYPLQDILPHSRSQNLIAVLPAKGETQSRVVLFSHLDSHRAVIWFANDSMVKIYNIMANVAVSGLFLAPLLYLLIAITGFTPAIWFGVILAITHFFAWFTGMTADLGLFSPGANDNAAAVGTVIALGERISQEPLQNTEVWLAFTGCGESGCDGMKSFLDAYTQELSEALFIDLEMIGIGEQLAYVQSEGVVRRKRIDPQVEKFLLDVGAKFNLQPWNRIRAGFFTEMGVVWERGLKGACLISLRESSPFLPEWHRLTDIPERLNPDTLVRVHEMLWDLLNERDNIIREWV